MREREREEAENADDGPSGNQGRSDQYIAKSTVRGEGSCERINYILKRII